MKTTYADAMHRGVYPHEGSYSDHPSDPGGCTNRGITIAVARREWKSNATCADMQTLPKTISDGIYRKSYATPLRYNELPAGLDYCVLDYGINSGIGRAGKVLRRVCGLPDHDWKVTDEVLAAIRERDAKQLIQAICDERLRFLKSLETWPIFGTGWGRRVKEVRALALNFANAPSTPVLTNSPVPGKGEVPDPKALKDAIKIGVPTAGGGAGIGWFDWVLANPRASVLIAVSVVVSIGLTIHFINIWRQSKQEAATPDTPVVPA